MDHETRELRARVGSLEGHVRSLAFMVFLTWGSLIALIIFLKIEGY